MPEEILTTPGLSPIAGPHRRAGWRLPVIGIFLAASVGGGWWYLTRGGAVTNRAGSPPSPGASGTSAALRVEVIRPIRGGLGRTVVQPGLVRSFEWANLYAKVSGYLIRQRVDIGDFVKKGQILAEVDAPELFKSRDQARASVGQVRAKIKQMEARVLTAKADRDSATASVKLSEAAVTRFIADRVYRKEEFDRIKDLANRQAIELRLVDEQRKQYEAALGAESEAQSAVIEARARLSASVARVVQAEADVEAAKADLDAAEAAEARTQVLVDYTRINSPYDGVITLRSFHDGDFIRSAVDGGSIPVLAVARIDLMRVIIMVPDLDVPFVNRGEPATIRVDALRDRVFSGAVARFGNSENEQKLVRTEVDVPNPDNLLRDGMYGKATIQVEPPSKNLRIPSSCLIEQSGQGEGAVYIVRDGKAHRQPVQVALDNGSDAEISRGLGPDDRVVVRYNGAIADGLAVRAEPARVAPAGVDSH